jgi:hypothetical protein
MLDGGIQEKCLIPPVVDPQKATDLVPIRVEVQRDVSDNKRKLLLLLAKDELTESEQAEMNELTAGREVIILEDT